MIQECRRLLHFRKAKTSRQVAFLQALVKDKSTYLVDLDFELARNRHAATPMQRWLALNNRPYVRGCLSDDEDEEPEGLMYAGPGPSQEPVRVPRGWNCTSPSGSIPTNPS